MINRELLLKHFTLNVFPNWICPRCNQGILVPVKESFHYQEGADFTEFKGKFSEDKLFADDDLISMPEYDMSAISDYRYMLFLRCNHCYDYVSSCGPGCDIEYSDSITGDTIREHAFFPDYFHPSINIFPIPEKCPPTVSDQIKSSFKLFFTDPPASANYIRKAIDAILTDKKIRKITISHKGKKVPINLHNRIVEFEKSNPDIAKNIFAIKWLGNEGSHTDKMTKNDVLDAYEILEVVIDDLYVGHRKQIEKKVTKINKSKKPLHPST